MARVTILQGLFISLMLALSVLPPLWAVYLGSSRPTSYVVLVSLVLFLIVVKWMHRSSIDHTAGLRREIIVAELSSKNRGSLLGAMILVFLCLAVWHLLSAVGYLRVSPFNVLKALSFLILEADIWKDMGVSLFEIFGGLVLSGGVALIVSMGLSTSTTFKRWISPMLPLTFIVPILVLVPWHRWFVPSWQSFMLYFWTAACVASLSFFPFVQALWGLRDQPLLCRILLAADDGLPYGFTAMIYGEMMSAIAGLGFAVVMAGGRSQNDKALAVFLLTLGLLAGLSSILRWVAKSFYVSHVAGQVRPAEAS